MFACVFLFKGPILYYYIVIFGFDAAIPLIIDIFILWETIK